MIGCTLDKRAKNSESWSDNQVSEWFSQKDWLDPTDLQPHPSIDKKEFAIRYQQNQERWDKAFSFLKEKNLSTIEVGNYRLDGRDVFVMVSEYNSKSHEDAQYEAHKNYTDIQYVVSGIEYIGLSDLSATSLKTPCDEEKDIAFYNVEESQNLIAKPGMFFIFFPGDVHRPRMKVEQNAPVKKIVIKVTS